jgi:3-methyladenine DNA glycosylase AlkC
MGAFRPVTYSSKELKGLTATKRKTLKKAIVRHLETHPQIRKIVRQKTRTLYNRLKKR